MRAVRSLTATILLASLATFSLDACAGVGVVETGDPAQKLRDAEALFAQKDRPLIAERLIREALAISEQQDDRLGIANAYRTYGFFFRSTSVSASWAEYYRKHGFLEPAVTWTTRLDGSIRFFQKAVEIYDGLSRYDAATNVYLNMGHTYTLMQDAKDACIAWAKALDSYHANLRVNPNARPETPPQFKSLEDFVNYLRAHENCPKDDNSRA